MLHLMYLWQRRWICVMMKAGKRSRLDIQYGVLPVWIAFILEQNLMLDIVYLDLDLPLPMVKQMLIIKGQSRTKLSETVTVESMSRSGALYHPRLSYVILLDLKHVIIFICYCALRDLLFSDMLSRKANLYIKRNGLDCCTSDLCPNIAYYR
jgi:hypothetical protein